MTIETKYDIGDEVWSFVVRWDIRKYKIDNIEVYVSSKGMTKELYSMSNRISSEDMIRCSELFKTEQEAQTELDRRNNESNNNNRS